MANNEAQAPLQWDQANCEASLQTLYGRVIRVAEGQITWYKNARKTKKYGGLLIRGSAVVLIAAAGLLPLIEALVDRVNGQDPAPVWLNPLYASVAVGVAAALVAFDRFFGFSSAWMRFMTTELTLRSALDEFQMDWHAHRAPLQGARPTGDQVAQMLTRSRTFVARINEIVLEETKAWVNEFTDSLSKVDEAVKAAEIEARTRADASKSGALNVQIVNFDKLTLPWKLAVDDGDKRECHSASAAVAQLSPGPHTVRVFAIVDGKERTAEKAFQVSASGIAETQITV